jgi:hypothetical protein
MTRLGLNLGPEEQDGSSSYILGLDAHPHLTIPTISEPLFPLGHATDQSSTEFDAVTYPLGLDEPLPASTWDEDPPPSPLGKSVVDTSFAVPNITMWPSWPQAAANEELDGYINVTTEFGARVPGMFVPAPLPQQLPFRAQEHTINPSLLPPHLGRPRARTAPTVFKDNTPNPPPSYPHGSPMLVPPTTPRSLYGSECGSSTHGSPFSQPPDLPSFGNLPGRLRSHSVSRGRPPTRQWRNLERVPDTARVRPHPSVHPDFPQIPTYNDTPPAPQHLDVPWLSPGLDVSEYSPDSPSTPSNLSRASSTSSVHRRPRSRSHSSTPYSKPSSCAAAGDGNTSNIGAGSSSTEHPRPHKSRQCNAHDEFPGQRFHFDEKFMETVLGDDPSLRKLLDNILGSSWRENHVVEPKYGAKNDNVSQGLQLPIERGASVLLAFILKADDKYTCILCKDFVSPRAPRQLGHVRGHIDLRPFPCTGCDSCDQECVVCCRSSSDCCPYISIGTLQGSFPRTYCGTTIAPQGRARALIGKLPTSTVTRFVSEFLLLRSGEKMRHHNLRRHIQTQHPESNGAVPSINDASSQWGNAPFSSLAPPSLDVYSIVGDDPKVPPSSKGYSNIPSASKV